MVMDCHPTNTTEFLYLAIKLMYTQRASPSRGDPEPTLQQYQGMHRQLEHDIQDNNREIKLLNNKIVKSDYDHTLLHKLEQRNQALMLKHRELEDIIANQEYIQRQMQSNKSTDKQYQHSLAAEYGQMQEEKRRRAEEERRRAIQQQKLMHEYNRKAMEDEHFRKKMAVEEQKRAVLEELALREQARLKQKEYREREKEDYNKKLELRSRIETQKDSVYKQYYNQFMENQQTLHNIYKSKAAITDRERDVQRAEFQKKEIQDFQQRVAREQEGRVQRMNAEKDMLRSFLQNQIEEKHRRKSQEREEELEYHSQVHRYQVNAAEAEQAERARRKDEQKRYDEELKSQTRTKSYSTNLNPNEGKPVHNPITNPIDFKIGITNPYVIRQYQHTKEKFIGDPHLKLRNLAMVGSTSLNNK